MEKKKDWTVIQLLNWTIQYFQSKDFTSPRADAELLLGHALQYKRLNIYLHFDELVPPSLLEQYREMVRKRLLHVPVQYIIGDTEFYSLVFQVNSNVLIPRSETEILVEKAIEICRSSWKEESQINLLDMGTGSGNIAISVVKNIPNAVMSALDISDDALEVARINARQHGVDTIIDFRCGSIYDIDDAAWKNLHGILSNPPYISDDDYKILPDEIRKYEPIDALYDRGNGFRFYPELCRRAQHWLRPGGFLITEVAMGGASRVQDIFKENGFCNVETFPDYNKIERVVCGWKNEASISD